MSEFFIAASILTIIALALTFWPLYRAPKHHGISRPVYNKAVYAERLQELEQEKEQKGLSDEEFEVLKHQLQQLLLEDIPSNGSNGQNSPKKIGKVVVAASLATVIATASATYYKIGNYKNSEDYYQLLNNEDLSRDALKSILADPGKFDQRYQVSDYLRAQSARINNNSQEVEEWLMMVQALLQVQNIKGAESTVETARKVFPNDLSLMETQARIFKVVDQNPLRAIAIWEKVLKAKPEHEMALAELAMANQSQGRYSRALAYWHQLKSNVPEGNDKVLERINENIEEINEQIALGNVNTQLIVNVSLAAPVALKSSPKDTVYVFARMSKGPPLPLAVAKTTVEELNKPIVLDDSMAMVKDFKLSTAKQVKLVARVSKSGEAKGQPGDFEGIQIIDLTKGENNASVQINAEFRGEQSTPAAIATAKKAQTTPKSYTPKANVQSSATQPATTKLAAGGAPQIRVTLSLADELASKVKKNNVLYVFAKAASGPPMPLAIVKTSVAELDKPIVLDDSKAMMEQLKLSNFKEVKVVARISKTGDATAKPGDLEGHSAVMTLKPGINSLTLEINSEIGAKAKQAASAKNTAIKIRISVSDALKSAIGKDDILYVFARAKQGPRMPLAVKRLTAAHLPIDITLSDKDAMSPQFKLSSFNDIIVVARVSKSGDVTAKPGDVEGQSAAVSLAKNTDLIKVVLDKKIQ